jgi:leucyl/phenylalanyl-tRNA--protein transferase
MPGRERRAAARRQTPARDGGEQLLVVAAVLARRVRSSRASVPDSTIVEQSAFGTPARWPSQDLIGVSEEFNPDLALTGYRSGAFPMPQNDLRSLLGVRGRLMGWFSPMRRAILPLDGLRITRSLQKMIKRYKLTVDAAFADVLHRCADPSRPGSWIDDRIADVYNQLHRAGAAHSVEAWTDDGQLAGGLYGVSVGGLFAGESMFHRPDIGRDASKVALTRLVDLLRADGLPRLLDVQWRTPHLASLGVVEIDRSDYLQRLSAALELPPPDWSQAHQPQP